VIHVGPLRAALEDYAGMPGVRPLRRLIDELTFRLSDSELEVRFRPIAAAAGLPTALSKQFVNGFEVDFFWPDLGLSSRRTEPVSTARPRRRRATRAGIVPTYSPA
jgi:hypothetical protein